MYFRLQTTYRHLFNQKKTLKKLIEFSYQKYMSQNLTHIFVGNKVN